MVWHQDPVLLFNSFQDLNHNYFLLVKNYCHYITVGHNLSDICFKQQKAFKTCQLCSLKVFSYF